MDCVEEDNLEQERGLSRSFRNNLNFIAYRSLISNNYERRQGHGQTRCKINLYELKEKKNHKKVTRTSREEKFSLTTLLK